MCRLPGAPGAQAYRLQPVDFARISHYPRPSDDRDTPAGLVGDVEAIGLESDDGVADIGDERVTWVGPDDDVTVIEGEMDKLHRRQRPPGEDDPADGHGGQEPERFIPGQLL